MTYKITEQEILEALEEAEMIEAGQEHPTREHLLKVAQRLCGADSDFIERTYNRRKGADW